MRHSHSNYASLPYLLFLYAAVVSIFAGGMLGYGLEPQWRVIISELVVLLGATLVARFFIEQAIIDMHLPSTIPPPKNAEGSFLSRFSLRNADLNAASFFTLLAAIPFLSIFTSQLAGLVGLLPAFQADAAKYMSDTSSFLPFNDFPVLIVGIVAVVVAAPIAEEFLFRGTILPLLRMGHPDAPVNAVLLVDAILFSVMHMNVFGFVSLTIVGFFLADLAVRSRSLMVPITAHAAYNLFNGVIFPLAVREVEHEFATADLLNTGHPSFQGVNVVMLLVSGVLLLVLWRLFRKHTNVEPFYKTREIAAAH